MKVNLPLELSDRIAALVSNGNYPNFQCATESLIAIALSRMTNKTSGRFAYPDLIYTDEELRNEEWRAFPEPEFSQYEVSNLGRVRSLRFGSRLIKLSAQNAGYRQAPVVSDTGRKAFPSVHRIVASAFLARISDKSEVNHRNGNKADNRVINLEWVSAVENSRHSLATGLRHWRGAHHRAKITRDDVLRIRAADPTEFKQFSDSLGISENQVRQIYRKKSWAHV